MGRLWKVRDLTSFCHTQSSFSFTGLRAAHIKVIFKLPAVYHVRTVHPLAYIEWYTPFNTPDPTTGLYTIKPSTRRHQAYGEIIEVDRIVRNLHVIPKCGREIDVSWTMENVVEKANSFFPNPYSDLHMFLLLKSDRHIHRTCS